MAIPGRQSVKTKAFAQPSVAGGERPKGKKNIKIITMKP
jgi:hypothetical protein